MQANILTTFNSLYKKYERQIPPISFLVGVGIDIATLNRIDSKITLWTQAAYLTVAGIVLLWEGYRWIKVQSGRGGPLWDHHVFVLHFIFGSLFSAFSIFYAKSGSLWTSAAFLALISGLLVANEFRTFRSGGIPLRFALFSLCMASYLNYVIPIFRGKIGLVPFLEALGVSFAVTLFLALVLLSMGGPRLKVAKVSVIPSVGAHALLAVLYLFEAIPPVPLSIKHIGVYQDIRKVDGKYELSYFRPAWKFWQSGAQTLLARKGDKLVVFVRIFSPANFADDLRFRWAYYNQDRGWQNLDVVPMKASGGSALGFRGYSIKENFVAGDWRVAVETSDSREVGRIYFSVENDESMDERTMTLQYF